MWKKTPLTGAATPAYLRCLFGAPALLPMTTHLYEVVRDIAEIGALVWDALAFCPGGEIVLVRKVNGEIFSWRYPSQYTFLFLKYEAHLQPLTEECPRLHDLAQRLMDDWPRPRPQLGSGAPYLRLAE